jgi:hypothetical protein
MSCSVLCPEKRVCITVNGCWFPLAALGCGTLHGNHYKLCWPCLEDHSTVEWRASTWMRCKAFHTHNGPDSHTRSRTTISKRRQSAMVSHRRKSAPPTACGEHEWRLGKPFWIRVSGRPSPVAPIQRKSKAVSPGFQALWFNVVCHALARIRLCNYVGLGTIYCRMASTEMAPLNDSDSAAPITRFLGKSGVLHCKSVIIEAFTALFSQPSSIHHFPQ